MRAFLNHNRKWLIRLTLAIALLVGCFSLNFSVGLFEYESLRAARTRWEANGIDDYRMIVSVGTFSNFGHYSIRVSDGEITEASRSDGHAFVPFPIEGIKDYTIDAQFERAESEIANVPPIHITPRRNPSFLIVFDENLGYIKNLAINCGGGILGWEIADCLTSFNVLEFEVFDRST